LFGAFEVPEEGLGLVSGKQELLVS
jgi:hypothetical protein